MTLIINGVDFSSYIQQKTDIVETPRRVEGRNGGMSISFKTIYDKGKTKYDAQFRLKPLPANMVRTLLRSVETVPSRVLYTSVLLDVTRNIEARVTLDKIHYLTDSQGQRIYGESVISIIER